MVSNIIPIACYKEDGSRGLSFVEEQLFEEAKMSFKVMHNITIERFDDDNSELFQRALAREIGERVLNGEKKFIINNIQIESNVNRII